MKTKISYLLFLLSILIIPLNSAPAPIHEVAKINKVQYQNSEQIYPVVILGSGISALTSSIYLQRAGIDTLIIEGPSPGGTIVQSPMVQNWPGEDAIPGQELVQKIHKQAKSNGATFLSEEVIAVDFSSDIFTIRTRDFSKDAKVREIKAYSCIIALGSKPNRLGVAGEGEQGGYWANGVYTCATCDGSLFKNKTVAVVGGGDSALIEAEHLSHLAKHVYVIVRASEFHIAEQVRKNSLLQKSNITVLYNTQVQEIQGNGKKVTHLLLNSNKKNQPLPVDGIFLAIGATPNTALFKDQLEIDKAGYIVLKNGQETSVKGVYAIGDIVDPIYKQAVSAAGDGAKAAIETERYLSSLPNAHDFKISKINNEADTSSSVVELKNEEDFKKLINGDMVIVDFYSSSCGPCKRLAPIFEDAASKFSDKALFLKVNINNFPDLAQEYEITGVPTVLVFKKGQLVDRKMGVEPVQRDIFDKL